MMEELVSTIQNVSSTLCLIKESSNQVAAGSEQLAISSQDLAKGATDQSIAVDNLVENVSKGYRAGCCKQQVNRYCT